VLVALALTLAAPSSARAADYVDPLDDFSVHVDPPGFIVCVTYPVERWDRTDCEGLNQEFEAGMRAQIPKGAHLIGTSVHRADAWGFRAQVLRFDGAAPLMNDADEPIYVDQMRAIVAARLRDEKIVVGPGGIDARMETLGKARAVRIAYETAGDTPRSSVAYTVLGERAIYTIEFLGAGAHSAELAAIADRAAGSVRVRPAVRKSAVLGVAGVVVVGLIALAGTIALFVSLAGGRKKTRTSAVSWPRTRG
jgi:hypothetical protein